MLEKLNALYKTLNNIEVKGEYNLGMLLGCIQMVAEMTSEIQNQDVFEDDQE